MKKLFLIIFIFSVFPSSGTAVTLFEGFESGIVPPSGWTHVQSNPNESWEPYTITQHSGSYAASVLYDPNLILQNEWLVSPSITPVSNFTVEAWSFGSIYWGLEVDNYDLSLWLIYNGIGGGDDIFVGNLDDDWLSTWTWSRSYFDLAGLFTSGVPVNVGFQYYGLDGAQAALDDITIQYAPIPEPSTFLLLGGGLAGLAFVARRRKKE